MPSTYDLDLTTYQIDEPEIYQIEATSACNFSCPFCIRGQPDYPATHMDPQLMATITTRDMGGSYYTELQFTGEPLIHPQFDELATMLGAVPNLKTGLSTNGSFLSLRAESILANIDYLTISVDSVDKERYENELRIGGTFDQLVSSCHSFLDEWQHREFESAPYDGAGPRLSQVDMQVIDFFDRPSERDGLQTFVDAQGWRDYVNVRSVPDCFAGFTAPELAPPREGLCLNPWMSVSVHADGDVVPCCFAFGKEFVYGNLAEASLKEIWNDSPVRKELQRQHIEAQATGEQVKNAVCAACYMRSPTFLHFKMARRFIS